MSALDREILAEKISAVQAVLIVIALAMSACLHLRLGAPGTYADAFRRLADSGHLDPALAAWSETPGSGMSSPMHTSDSTWRASIAPPPTGPMTYARSSRRSVTSCPTEVARFARVKETIVRKSG